MLLECTAERRTESFALSGVVTTGERDTYGRQQVLGWLGFKLFTLHDDQIYFKIWKPNGEIYFSGNLLFYLEDERRRFSEALSAHRVFISSQDDEGAHRGRRPVMEREAAPHPHRFSVRQRETVPEEYSERCAAQPDTQAERHQTNQQTW